MQLLLFILQYKKQFLLIHLNDGFTYCASLHHPREVLQSLLFQVHSSSRGWIYLNSFMSHRGHRESACRQWDASEACLILYTANTDGLHLPPGRDVKCSCIVKCEHCHTNLTKITVVVIHTQGISISGIFAQCGFSSLFLFSGGMCSR